MYADQVHAKTPKSWSSRIYRVAKDERQDFIVPFVSYALYYAPVECFCYYKSITES